MAYSDLRVTTTFRIILYEPTGTETIAGV